MVKFFLFPFYEILMVPGNMGLTRGSAILILAIFVAVSLSAGFVIVNSYKRKLAFRQHDLVQQINELKQQKKACEKDIAGLQEKLKIKEQEQLVWTVEREKLLQEINDLENQIKQLSDKKEPGKKDVIIEFFMNNDK